MAAAAKKKWIDLLKRGFQLQQTNVFIAVSIYALCWLLGATVPLGILLVFTLCVGNIISPLMQWLSRWYDRRPFPVNWLLYLPLLTLTSLASVSLANVLISVLGLTPANLTILIRQNTLLPLLVCLIAGIVVYANALGRARLEAQNLALQEALHRNQNSLDVQEGELQKAREIQEALLPRQMPRLHGAEVHTRWQPSRVVSGDFFDAVRLDDTRLGVCIGDVVGKSITAALLMANLQAAFRAFASTGEGPAELCGRLNDFLCQNLAHGKFITLFYGVLETDTRRFRYCNAGHLPALVVRRFGEPATLETGGALLGIFPGWTYETGETQLESGDRLLLYTDGVVEAMDAADFQYGLERLADQVRARAGTGSRDLLPELLEDVTRHCRGEFHDDATMLLLEVR